MSGSVGCVGCDAVGAVVLSDSLMTGLKYVALLFGLWYHTSKFAVDCLTPVVVEGLAAAWLLPGYCTRASFVTEHWAGIRLLKLPKYCLV